MANLVTLEDHLKIKEKGKRTVAIVVPVYNEQEVLPIFHHEVSKVIATLPDYQFNIIYINDGSTDGSWQILNTLSNEHTGLSLINLSRNFGKEAALTAGLQSVNEEAAIILDADLQDPPSLIPQMLKEWSKGFDVVNMKRSSRQGESYLKKATANVYYKLLSWLAEVRLEKNVGDFRLMSQKVIQQVNQLTEKNRYMKGILSWPGFKQTTLTFDRPERAAGETKWGFFALVQLAIAGITAFSVKPLRLATILGGTISVGAFMFAAFIGLKTLLFGEPVAGFPTIVLIQLFMGGIQLLTIGILGEYVGRIFTETKDRPIFVVMDEVAKPQPKLESFRNEA